MELILDSSVLIEAERGNFSLKTWLRSLPPTHIYLPAIVAAELLHGLERATAKHKLKRQNFLDSVLARTPILDYTMSTAKIHAKLWAEMERKGKMIGYYDLIIAATALEHGSTVATFNRRHFIAVPDLQIITPERT
jgi:tRNA(fMet)-specific endonuclease VapC